MVRRPLISLALHTFKILCLQDDICPRAVQDTTTPPAFTGTGMLKQLLDIAEDTRGHRIKHLRYTALMQVCASNGPYRRRRHPKPVHFSNRSPAHTQTTAQILSTQMVEICVNCRKGKENGGEVICDRVDQPMYAFDRVEAYLKNKVMVCQ